MNPQMPVQPPGSGGESQPRASGSAFRVLYVEDNSANFRLVQMLLASQPGVEVVQAATVREAFELVHSLQPDLMLLDRHLPDGTGNEVLARLKADPATTAIPVVGITADARQSQVDELVAAGAEQCLTKPIDAAQLLELVARAREGRT